MEMRLPLRAVRSVALVLLLVGVGCLYPLLGHSSQAWPPRDCVDEDYWLEFTGLQFCVDKERVAYINHLNFESPSTSLRLFTEHGENEIGFSRLTDEEVTGGLHEHLNISVREVFQLLQSHDGSSVDVELAKRVMSVGEGAEVRHYSDDQLEAYAIIRGSGDYSSIYVRWQGMSGAVKIAGIFGREYAERLLSYIRRMR